MSATFLNCPHCLAERIGFSLILDRQTARTTYQTVARCNGCGEIVVLWLNDKVGGTAPVNCAGNPLERNFEIIRQYPQRREHSAPEHTPDNIAHFYVQALDNALRRQPDASGGMSRKVVDVATKQMFAPDDPLRRKPTFNRIEALAADGRLTKDLAEWAHHVRIEGNEAVHDDEPYNQEQADELVKFAELFLTYVFTLPGQLAAARAAGASEETG